MHRALFLISLLAAGIAGAAPRVSDAVVIRPDVVYTVPPSAIAGVPGNLMIAWVENVDHVMLARLDDDLHLIDASVEEIGRGDYPRLAYDGEHFFVAFVDTRQLRLVLRRTDGVRTASIPAPRTVGLIPEARPAPLPYSLIWSGGALHLLFGVSGVYDWPVSADLEVGEPRERIHFNVGQVTLLPAAAMAGNVLAGAANAEQGLIDFGTTASPTAPFATIYAVASFFAPAVATNGREFLVVTRSRCASSCGELRARRFDLDATPTAPPEGRVLASGLRYDFDRLTAAAWTGSAYLVVYGVRTSFDEPPAVDLWGVLVAPDGTGGEPFPIAAAAGAERVPTLLVLGGGQVLITYLADGALEARIVFTAPPARSRPVRGR